MVAAQVHLVRHGEVFNPDGVLYGRMPGFGLSKLGHRMARSAADDLVSRERVISRLIASPLQRTQESAAPISDAFQLAVEIEPRIIEPSNHFEGLVMRRAVRQPRNWPYLVNPLRPSWGEPYKSIAARMRAALADAFDSVDDGDVVMVSHQLPIWTTHLSVAGEGLAHNPAHRRCNLSSITSFSLRTDPETGEETIVQELATATETAAPSASGPLTVTSPEDGPVFFEVSYTEPARDLQSNATDVGAV